MEFRRALVRNTNGALLARCRLNLGVPGGCAAAGDVAVQCTCVQRAGTLETSAKTLRVDRRQPRCRRSHHGDAPAASPSPRSCVGPDAFEILRRPRGAAHVGSRTLLTIETVRPSKFEPMRKGLREGR